MPIVGHWALKLATASPRPKRHNAETLQARKQQRDSQLQLQLQLFGVDDGTLYIVRCTLEGATCF